MFLFMLSSASWLMIWMHCNVDKPSIGLILWMINHVLLKGKVRSLLPPAMKVKSNQVSEGDVECSDPCFRCFERLLFSPLSTRLLVLCAGKSIFSTCAAQRNSDEMPSFSASLSKSGAGEGIWAGCRWHGCPGKHSVALGERSGWSCSLYWHVVLVCGLLPLSNLSSLLFSRKSLCSVSWWVRCSSNSFYFVYNRCILFHPCHREGCWRDSPSCLASDAILLYFCVYGRKLGARKVIRKPC